MFHLLRNRAASPSKRAYTTVRRWLGIPRSFALILGLFLATGVSFPADLSATIPRSFHIDCDDGVDSNDGLQPGSAWRTPQRAAKARLQPGDSLLLKRGCSWSGPLYLSWTGTAAQPIRVAAYGDGPRPLIQKSGNNVVVGGSYLTIEQLATRADAVGRDPECQNQPIGRATGFRFEAGAAYNVLRDVEASGLTHGVKIVNGAHHNQVLNSTFTDNRLMFALDRDDPSNDSGAVGIVLDGDDNEIAYNTFSGHDACSYDYERDGAAVEVYGGRRNLIHHNTSINNNAFSELGHPRSADNVYAYNRVVADVADAHFLVTRGAGNRRGPVRGTVVYNNTVFLTHPTSTGVSCEGGCDKDILSLRNNILWVEGKAALIDTRGDEGNNLYWRSDGHPYVFVPAPQDMSATSSKADPLFVDTAAGDFHLQTGSPAINAGTPLAAMPETVLDLDGRLVPQQGRVDIGAFEYSTPGPDYVRDAFSRDVTAGWGAAEQGGSYTLMGEAADYGVGHNAASITIGAPGTTRAAYLPDVTARDTDTYVQLRIDRAAAEDNQFAYIVARRSAAGAEYRLKLRFAPDGKLYMHATRVIGDTEHDIGAELATGITYIPGSLIRVRAQVSGTAPTTLRIKVWAEDELEPIGWLYYATDQQPELQAAGAAGLRAYVGSSHLDLPVRFNFEAFRVTATAP